MARYDTLKYNMELFGLYIRLGGNEDAMKDVILDEKSFKTKMITIIYNDEYEEISHTQIAKISKEMKEFQ